MDNNDIFVDPELITAFPQASHLFVDEALETKFSEFESRAIKYKSLHAVLGKSALVMLTMALALSILKLVAAGLGAHLPEWLTLLFVVCGATPLAIALVLWRLKFHHKWILARYQSERIRHFRYHQFLDGSYVEDTEFELRRTKARTLLLGDIESGIGGLHNYMNNNVFDIPFTTGACANQQKADEVIEAYQVLRIDVQNNFFEQQRGILQRRDAISSTISRGFLALSMTAAFADGISILLPFQGISDLHLVLPGIAVFFAVMSAVTRVFRSATGVSEDHERFASKANLLRSYAASCGRETSHEKKLKWMYEIERTLASELVDFLRTAEKSDYFI